ncbi:restriction endonuclease subunit S [Cohaesibacter marisflavi]|uniref:restriction endonuclease subunit S n=1 Tax=Cohaesibacter marisflavi TaxID=655353 RepID=UPI0029C62F3D|nr:restriction endonuclease subunit S [Cohaesibacter marisflavi]
MSTLRGDIRSTDIAGIILRECAKRLDVEEALSGELDGEWEKHKDDSLMLATVSLILDLPLEDRLEAISDMLQYEGMRPGAILWLKDGAAKQIAGLVRETGSVRCSFVSSLHSMLCLGIGDNKPSQIRFIDHDRRVCEIAKITSAMMGLNVEVILGDPFQRKDEGEFDCELCVPPLGMIFQRQDEFSRSVGDWFGHSSRPPRVNSETVAIVDLLVNTKRSKCVLVVTGGALSRAVGVENLARAELVESGRLASVFSAPSGMVYSNMGINCAVITLDPLGVYHDKVRFVDLAHRNFSESSGRGRTEAKVDIPWIDVIDANEADGDITVDVSVAEIHKQGNNLMVQRYLTTGAGSKVSKFLEGYGTKTLDEICKIVRPLAIPRNEDGEFVVHEVLPGDVPEFGRVQKASKVSRTDQAGLRKAKNQQLMTGDVLFSVKGTIGVVGIVLDDIGNESDICIASQSFIVLRPAEDRLLSEVLYEFLSNRMVVEHIRSMASGAAVQMLNIKDIKAIEIPVPAMDEQREIKEAFDAVQKRVEKLKAMERELRSDRMANWPHMDLSLEE